LRGSYCGGGVYWRVGAFPVIRVCVAVGVLVLGQRLLLLFDVCAITCGLSSTVLAVWGDLISFRSVLVFSPALPSPFCFYYLIIAAIVFIIIDYYCYHYFHGVLALCDGCLGWGWVWLAGLMAGCG